MRDTPQQFSRLTLILHWTIGLTMIVMIGIGVYMVEWEAYGLYPIHKSTGILLFALILIRVVWRLINGWPAPASKYEVWEQNLAKVVHWVLLIGSMLLPLSGMMMSGAGGHGLSLYGLDLLAANPDPGNPGDVIALNGSVAKLGHDMHHWLGEIMIVAIVLHIAGAMKHHVMDGDGTLRRMLGAHIKAS